MARPGSWPLRESSGSVGSAHQAALPPQVAPAPLQRLGHLPQELPAEPPRLPVPQPHQVLNFSSVGTLLDWLGQDPLLAGAQRFLESRLWGRLVLLSEIPPQLCDLLVKRGLLHAQGLKLLNDAILKSQGLVPRHELRHPSRFLPPNCYMDELLDLRANHNDRLVKSRPLSWTWLELLASGAVLTAGATALAIEGGFRELEGIARWNLDRTVDLRFLFTDRCLISGCSTMALVEPIDETRDVSQDSRWSEGPRKRISMMVATLMKTTPSSDSVPLEAWRFPGHLAAERALRMQLVSIRGSWKSTRSGLFCWQAFVASVLRNSRLDYPILIQDLAEYSQFFANGDSFSRYLSHLRFSARLHQRPDWLPDSSLTEGLCRGLRKCTLKKVKPVLSQDQMTSLVVWLTRQGLTELARLIVIARTFLFRVQSELLPLRLDGGKDSPGSWHSKIDSHGPKALTVFLQRRKNAPEGAELLRSCVCKEAPRTLCGVCALQAQIRHHSSLHKSPKDPLFNITASAGLIQIRRGCSELGLPNISWHSFRRSAARDMMSRGCSLAQILMAGGWRSSAFLRYLCKKDVDARMSLELSFADSGSD